MTTTQIEAAADAAFVAERMDAVRRRVQRVVDEGALRLQHARLRERLASRVQTDNPLSTK